ncbi:hypothetical protein MD484_g2079, partial [Candolleomyces efflorescens]
MASGSSSTATKRKPSIPSLIWMGPTNVDDIAENLAEAEQRPKKKKKMNPPTTDDATTLAKPTRRRRDLSLLPTMPIDILFEILGQLSPKDLVNLSRINKLFRETLLARNTKTVWKTARERLNAPKPPRGFTEQMARNSSDFNESPVARHASTPLTGVSANGSAGVASKRNESAFEVQFPNYNWDLLEYVPSTDDDGKRSRCDPVIESFYWDTDIRQIGSEWEHCRNAAAEGKPGAQQTFDAWKKYRKDIVASHRKTVGRYERWQDSQIDRKQAEFVESREKRLNAFKTRFMKLGYTEEDFDRAINISSEGIYSGTPNVTTAIWNKYRPEFERKIRMERNFHRALALRDAIVSRLEMIRGLYATRLSSMKPSATYFYPPVEFLWSFPEVANLLESDKTITAKDFQHVIDRIDEYVGCYNNAKRKLLLDALPSHEISRVADPFSLARYVFQQADGGNSGTALLGWPAIASHSSLGTLNYGLRLGVAVNAPLAVFLNPPMSAISTQLIILAGLDPATATIDDMEDRDLFVFCRKCKAEPHRNNYGVYTWRGALQHAFERHNPNRLGDTPFSARGADLLNNLFAHEPSGAKLWSCNHCHEFQRDNAETEATILEHLASVHQLVNSTAHEDYFVNELRKPFLKGFQSVTIVKRVRCPICDTLSDGGDRSSRIHSAGKAASMVDDLVFETDEHILGRITHWIKMTSFEDRLSKLRLEVDAERKKRPAGPRTADSKSLRRAASSIGTLGSSNNTSSTEARVHPSVSSTQTSGTARVEPSIDDLKRTAQALEDKYASLSVKFDEVGDLATKWHQNYNLECSHHRRTYEQQGRMEMKYIQAMKDVHRLEKELKDAKGVIAPADPGRDADTILAFRAELNATKEKSRQWKERARVEKARYLSMAEQKKGRRRLTPSYIAMARRAPPDHQNVLDV